MGFADTGRAQRLLAEIPWIGSGPDREIVAALAAAADPDQALTGLARMAPDAGLLAALRDDDRLRDRLTAVLGASSALAGHLSRHPADWRLLAGDAPFPSMMESEPRAEMLAAVGASPDDAEPVAAAVEGNAAASCLSQTPTADRRSRPDRRGCAGRSDVRAGRPDRGRAGRGAGDRQV
jgi:glutamate-ammonia-ligase adenylyltransferase